MNDPFVVKQVDDDMHYQDAFNIVKMRAQENPDLVTALNNVLTLASERLDLIQLKGVSIGYQPIFDKNRDSIKAIKKFLHEYQSTNVALAKSDKDRC